MIYRTLILTPDLKILPRSIDCEPEDLNYVLHELLNGFFEIVRPLACPRHIIMLVDDEGILKDLPFNPLAAALYGQYIAGNAIIMREGFVNGEPDIVGLQTPDIAHMVPRLNAIRKGYKAVIEHDEH